jgi:prolyl-tRNA synthetase
MYNAYCRIFERLGLKFRAVEADSGPIGGSFSHEFMVLADTGEDLIVSCSECDYAANMEKAEIKPFDDAAAAENYSIEEMEKVLTPDVKSIEQVTKFLKVSPARLIKTLVFVTENGPVAALVRGDHEINEVKLKNFLKCESLELAEEDVIEKLTNAPRGFAGPVGMKDVKIIADFALRGGRNFIAGANEKDAHLKNVNFDRDFSVSSFADVRCARQGDPCPRCGKKLLINRGIEVGHIFKLGTKYSRAMDATYLDPEGRAQPIVMGCYGIGVGRTVAAAIEQSHDKNGIIFPESIAPFQVMILPVDTSSGEQMEIAEEIYNDLMSSGIDVLIDDRDERPGIKFKDADMIGVPVRVTIGRNAVNDNMADIKWRKTGEVTQVLVKDAVSAVIEGLGCKKK